MRSQEFVELIEHDARTDAHSASFQIEIGDLPKGTGEIDDEPFADGPADEPGSRAAWNYGYTHVSGGFDDGAGLTLSFWKSNGQGLDLIDRSVSGVKLAR